MKFVYTKIRYVIKYLKIQISANIWWKVTISIFRDIFKEFMRSVEQFIYDLTQIRIY